MAYDPWVSLAMSERERNMYRRIERSNDQLLIFYECENRLRAIVRGLGQLYSAVSDFVTSMLVWLGDGFALVSLAASSGLERVGFCGPCCGPPLLDRFGGSAADLAAGLRLRPASVPTLYRLALRSLPPLRVRPSPGSSLRPAPVGPASVSGSVGRVPCLLVFGRRLLLCDLIRWCRSTRRKQRHRSSTRRFGHLVGFLTGPARSRLSLCSAKLLGRFELRIFRPPRRSRSCRLCRLTAWRSTFLLTADVT